MRFSLADMLWTVGLLGVATLGASVPWRLESVDLSLTQRSIGWIMLFLYPVALAMAVTKLFPKSSDRTVAAVLLLVFMCLLVLFVAKLLM